MSLVEIHNLREGTCFRNRFEKELFVQMSQIVRNEYALVWFLNV